ncbi:MAG: hypothetical protein HYU43_09315 [Armatimonadetes bacterium]|nr:hypothetical protein [Armatimonadota bacterium]
MKTLFSIAPNFSYYNPVTRLVDGREVGFPLVGAGLVFLLSLRGGVLAVLGGILFQQRELAKLAR